MLSNGQRPIRRGAKRSQKVFSACRPSIPIRRAALAALFILVYYTVYLFFNRGRMVTRPRGGAAPGPASGSERTSRMLAHVKKTKK